MRLIDESEIDAATDAAIRAGLVACFPADAEVFAQSREWHGSRPAFSAVEVSDGAVIAHAGVTDRTLTVGRESLRVAGIMNVFVLAEHRGRGLSDGLLNLAMAEAWRRGFDAGLLFCAPGLEKVYARAGWRGIDAPVTRIDETGARVGLPAGNIAMALDPRGIWPNGEIDLGGNDW